MNNKSEDVTTIGLSVNAHEKLKSLKQEGYFDEMVDAYRFAIGIAISLRLPDDDYKSTQRTTIFNVGTLDPEGEIRTLVSILFPAWVSAPYKKVEMLAEAGVQYLMSSYSGSIPLVDIVTLATSDET